MGAWGREPWDNDSAADWFGDLWEDVPIVDRVLSALDGPEGEEALAAVWLCTELCRVYVWPIDRYGETLDHAIAAADRLLARKDANRLLDLWDDVGASEVTVQLEGFRRVLVDRRAKSGNGPVASQDP